MSTSKRGKRRAFLSENLLMVLTIFGAVTGVTLGLVLKNTKMNAWTEREIMYIRFPGEMFLRMLKMLILPLIISSIISAIGSLDFNLSGRIGIRSVIMYTVTTACAVLLGIILVVTIRPGDYAGDSLNFKEEKTSSRRITIADTLLDLIRNIFPPNIVQATIAQYRTELSPSANDLNNTSKDSWKITHSYGGGTNILGLIVAAIIFGITIGKMGYGGRNLLYFFTSLFEAMMIITNWVVWLSPIGIASLVCAQLLEINDVSAIVGSLGMYFLTVLIGLILHGFVTLSIIYFACTGETPFRKIGKMGQVLMTAFGTASSSATLPVTLRYMDEIGVDPRISRFVIPIGSTINMDGAALYEAVAPIFIAQLRKINLSISNIIAISITATAASIGAAGIPQAGLVTMVMVLSVVGLPDRDVSLIVAVDWLLDRFRTTINVIGDVLVTIIVEKMTKKELSYIETIEDPAAASLSK